MKLLEKTRTGSRVTKKYDKPQIKRLQSRLIDYAAKKKDLNRGIARYGSTQKKRLQGKYESHFREDINKKTRVTEVIELRTFRIDFS